MKQEDQSGGSAPKGRLVMVPEIKIPAQFFHRTLETEEVAD